MSVVTESGRSQFGWVGEAGKSLERSGYAVVEGVLPPDFLTQTKTAMQQVQAAIRQEIGQERLDRAGELGVLRLMLKYHPHFYRLLELPELIVAVDNFIGETAIMHLQNGFILPSLNQRPAAHVFQTRFHQDFPRYMNGYRASVNVLFAVDAFSRENGATWVIPGSHQKPDRPSESCIAEQAIPVECPAGSMLIFDSTLWHAAGHNSSGQDRYAINHQFTRSFIKQQIDYVRALGDETILKCPPRTQQLLGYYTRVVTSLDEYYRPEHERLYRKGQG